MGHADGMQWEDEKILSRALAMCRMHSSCGAWLGVMLLCCLVMHCRVAGMVLCTGQSLRRMWHMGVAAAGRLHVMGLPL